MGPRIRLMCCSVLLALGLTALVRGEDTVLAVRGTVLLPSGQPAAGASVYLGTRRQMYLQLMNNRPRGYGDADTLPPDVPATTTADDGSFTLPGQIADFIIAVVHEGGGAQIRRDALATNSKITLTPWGRVEGTVKIGTKPAANVDVSAQFYDPADTTANHVAAWWWYQVKTDADGRFVIDHALPGMMNAGRWIRYSRQSSGQAHSVQFKVEPGKTTSVTIGGTGRSVIGRLVLPDELQKEDWDAGECEIATTPGAAMPKFTPPAGFENMTMEEKKAWGEKWRQTDEGKRYVDEAKKAMGEMRRFKPSVQEDGSIRADEIPPGHYTLAIEIIKRAGGDREPIATAVQPFVMPEIPGGASDDPLDLGAIAAKPTTFPRVGQVMSPLAFKTLDGKDANCQDYKGKYILLSFWTATIPSPGNEAADLRPAAQAYANDGHLVILSLNVEGAPEVRKLVAQEKLEPSAVWIQGYVGGWQTILPLGIRGMPVSRWLIGPDGKVISKSVGRGNPMPLLETQLGKPKPLAEK